MPLYIQYTGFQVQPHGRDYAYYVLDPPAASRRFTYTIAHQVFAEKRILYQDAAALCYQHLQRALLTENQEQPLRPHCFISDQELDDFRDTHYSTARRS